MPPKDAETLQQALLWTRRAAALPHIPEHVRLALEAVSTCLAVHSPNSLRVVRDLGKAS